MSNDNKYAVQLLMPKVDLSRILETGKVLVCWDVLELLAAILAQSICDKSAVV